MSKFQDMLKRDRALFLNPHEFAEMHEVEGKQMIAVVASDSISGVDDGISSGKLQLHARTEDLPRRRTAGANLRVDGNEYLVESWDEAGGMSSVVLTRNFGM